MLNTHLQENGTSFDRIRLRSRGIAIGGRVHEYNEQTTTPQPTSADKYRTIQPNCT